MEDHLTNLHAWCKTQRVPPKKVLQLKRERTSVPTVVRPGRQGVFQAGARSTAFELELCADVERQVEDFLCVGKNEFTGREIVVTVFGNIDLV